MGRIEKTVFISYRRTDESWGLAVFENLTKHGYDVFIDYDGIASDNFEAVISENIKSRAHFLVLLTPTALERCSDPKDWMRREIEAALDSQRNIVPLMLEGFDFGTPPTASQLTGKLAALKKYNGLPIPQGYFSPAMERLRNKFLNLPVDAVLHEASTSAQQVATEQKDKAAKAQQSAPSLIGEEKRKRQEAAPQRHAEVERQRREPEAKRRAEEEARQRAAEEERRKREAKEQRDASVTWSESVKAEFPKESLSHEYRYRKEEDGSIAAINAKGRRVAFRNWESFSDADNDLLKKRVERQRREAEAPEAERVNVASSISPEKRILGIVILLGISMFLVFATFWH